MRNLHHSKMELASDINMSHHTAVANAGGNSRDVSAIQGDCTGLPHQSVWMSLGSHMLGSKSSSKTCKRVAHQSGRNTDTADPQVAG